MTIFGLQRRLPLLIEFSFSPNRLVRQGAFMVLRDGHVCRQITSFRQPKGAEFLLVLNTGNVFTVRRQALLFLFANEKVFVIGSFFR